MDEFEVVIKPVRGKGEEDVVDEALPVKIADQDDGTYIVTYTLPKAGKWKVSQTARAQGQAGLGDPV